MQAVEITTHSVDSRNKEAPRVDVSSRPLVPIGPAQADVEMLLAEALAKAAGAGEWEVVMQLAKELEARRTKALARTGEARTQKTG
jgi:hypothetical protein